MQTVLERRSFSSLVRAAEFSNCSHSTLSHYSVLVCALRIVSGSTKYHLASLSNTISLPRWTTNLLDFTANALRLPFSGSNPSTKAHALCVFTHTCLCYFGLGTKLRGFSVKFLLKKTVCWIRKRLVKFGSV